MSTAVQFMTDTRTRSDFDSAAPAQSSTVSDRDADERIKALIPWANRQIAPLAAFDSNWDGYGASKLNRIAADHAAYLLAVLRAAYKVTEPILSLTPDGGVS